MSDESTDASLLAKQSGITFGGKIVMRGLEFLFLATVTRFLAPSAYGVFTLGIAVLMFTQRVSSLNLNKSIDYFVPPYLSDGEYGKAKGTLITAVVVALVLSSLAAGVVYLASPRLSELLNEPDLARVLPAMSLAIPLLALYRISLNSFNSIKRMEFRVYTQNLLRPISKLAIVTGLLVAGMGVSGLIAGYIASLLLTVVLGAFLLVTRVDWIRDAPLSRVPYRSMVSYSLPLVFVGAIHATVGQIDYFLLSYLGTSADVGLYRVGSLLAGNLTIVLLSVQPVFKPLIAERQGEPDVLQENYQLITRWVVMLILPLAITLALAARSYLAVLFTEQYAAANVAVMVLAVGYVLNVMFGPEGRMLEGLGHTNFSLVNSVILVGVNAALDALLIPHLGIVGAAVGTASALVVAGLAGVIEIRYLEGIHPYSWDLLRVLAAGGLTLAGSLPIVSLLENHLLTAVTLPVVVLALYLGALVVVGGFTEADGRIARSIDTKLGYQVVSRVVTPRN